MKQITVKKIIQAPEDSVMSNHPWGPVGKFVSVRPCNEKYQDKTYLGLYIGDIALGLGTSYDEKKKELSLHHSFHNPSIFVFDLNEVIFGAGSWWGEIKNENDLKEITNADIDNVWYVKALKQLEKTDKHD